METEMDGQTYNRTTESYLETVLSHFKKRQLWIRCPRCIGGKMYKESSTEYVCLQCGCTFNPDKFAKTPSIT